MPSNCHLILFRDDEEDRPEEDGSEEDGPEEDGPEEDGTEEEEVEPTTISNDPSCMPFFSFRNLEHLLAVTEKE